MLNDLWICNYECHIRVDVAAINDKCQTGS